MLTKNSLSFTRLFLYYQTLENRENNLYTKFSIETNRAIVITLDMVVPWFSTSLSRKYSYTIFNANSIYTIFIFCKCFPHFFFFFEYVNI